MIRLQGSLFYAFTIENWVVQDIHKIFFEVTDPNTMKLSYTFRTFICSFLVSKHGGQAAILEGLLVGLFDVLTRVRADEACIPTDKQIIIVAIKPAHQQTNKHYQTYHQYMIKIPIITV